MRVLKIALLAVVCSVVVAAQASAHCSKKHSEQVEIAHLQHQMAEVNVSSETLMLEKMLRKVDEQRAKEKEKEEKEKAKSLDELIDKLKIKK